MASFSIEAIRKYLSLIIDPEIDINIVDLGLIYAVNIDEQNNVYILLTFTSPTCPFSDIIVSQIHDIIENHEGIGNLDIEITFTPPWDQSMMSEAAQMEKGLW